jgi:hypothetical protein
MSRNAGIAECERVDLQEDQKGSYPTQNPLSGKTAGKPRLPPGRQPIDRNSAPHPAKGEVQNLASRATGPIVLRHGHVKGMSRTATCEVLARKIPLGPKLKTGSHEYSSDCAVIDAPADLPDGEYLIYFDEHVISATKKGAYWLSRGTANLYRDAIFLAS